MKTIDRRLLNIFLVCTILVLYFGSLTVVNLTDPDEVFYSMTAQEMIEHNSFLTPFIFDQPQFEKPPLFYWGLMASFKMFGVHTFTARLVPVMCGLFGLLTTFLFCRRVFSERIAYFVTLMLSASVLYLGMSKAFLGMSFFVDLDRGHFCGLSARAFETCQLYLACDAGFGDIAGHFDQRTFETRAEAQCFGCHLRDLRVWHHGGAVRSGQPFS